MDTCEKVRARQVRAGGGRCWYPGVLLLIALLLAGCGGITSAPPAPPAGAPAAAAEAPKPLPGPYDWSSAVLYFVLIDRFADGDPSNDFRVDLHGKGAFHGGDLAGLIQELDEITGLGVTALWINPVVKNIDGAVTGAGFPDWGYHGYWADDFYRVDPRFGSEAQLHQLVAECHKRGVRVLLDVVYNHAGYDSHYITDPRTHDWLRTGAACGQDDLTLCVAGLPDFKTELPYVADFLMKAHLGLARRSGLDGFRLDTVKHVDHPFWREHRRRTREELGPGFFLLGEVWGGDPQVLEPWFADDEMDAGFDFAFQGSVLAFVQGRGRTIAFDRYLKSREKIHSGRFVSHFLSTHDVPGALYQLGGDVEKFRLAAVLQFTSAGIPMIYYGEEVGRRGGDWPDNRSDMPWGEKKILPGAGVPRDEALRDLYRRLIAIRRGHPALWRGIHSGLATDGDLYIFVRRDAVSGEAVVVAVNRGGAAATASVAAPAEWGARDVVDLLSDAPVARSGDSMTLTVPPRSAQIVAPARTSGP